MLRAPETLPPSWCDHLHGRCWAASPISFPPWFTYIHRDWGNLLKTLISCKYPESQSPTLQPVHWVLLKFHPKLPSSSLTYLAHRNTLVQTDTLASLTFLSLSLHCHCYPPNRPKFHMEILCSLPFSLFYCNSHCLFSWFFMKLRSPSTGAHWPAEL